MAQAYQELLAKKQEIEQQKRDLDQQLQASEAEWKKAKISEVKMLMEQAGLTLEDIGGKARPVRTKPKAKYSDGTNTWSGRGLTPKWLHGLDKEQFRIKSN